MPFTLKSISGYEPVATGTDYCSICRYYKKGFCSILLRSVNPKGWCRLFKEKA